MVERRIARERGDTKSDFDMDTFTNRKLNNQKYFCMRPYTKHEILKQAKASRPKQEM
jgi:hypothetical protein